MSDDESDGEEDYVNTLNYPFIQAAYHDDDDDDDNDNDGGGHDGASINQQHKKNTKNAGESEGLLVHKS